LGSIVDLHTHTRVGSADSRIDEHEMFGLRTYRPALDGVVLTEHLRRWPEASFDALRATIFAVNARECETRSGHILVIGVPDEALVGVHDLRLLRKAADEHAGALILAHPFRHYPSSWNLLFPASHERWTPRHHAEWPPERLAEHPAFAAVHAVETLNGGCLPAQNLLALAVARASGLPTVGGSDAHDRNDIGYVATAFADDIASEAALITAIKAGRCSAVSRQRDGSYTCQ
jgi:predicted metal-dependent phosphoesterase TrpH